MTFPERLGISQKHLSHIVTEREQLVTNIVGCQPGLDPDQAMNVFLPVSISMVLTATNVDRQHAALVIDSAGRFDRS